MSNERKLRLDQGQVPADFQIDVSKMERHEGQKANREKASNMRERFLLREACDFGDSMVRHITMRLGRYTGPQLVWGLCLGIYCMRRDLR